MVDPSAVAIKENLRIQAGELFSSKYYRKMINFSRG